MHEEIQQNIGDLSDLRYGSLPKSSDGSDVGQLATEALHTLVRIREDT
jgi:hypothetical protein